MPILEYVIIGFKILYVIFILITFFYGFHAIYYAYFKTKDERQKNIVKNSATLAFSIILFYFIADIIFTYITRKPLKIPQDDSTTPLGFILITFSICLFINKRRLGGS